MLYLYFLQMKRYFVEKNGCLLNNFGGLNEMVYICK